MEGFFAQEVHSPESLNVEVFRAIRDCGAFFAVMHKRGLVQYPGHPDVQRSSVWIQQEIAVLCYRMFLEAAHIPIRVYMETGILLEGVMRTAIVNPLPFTFRGEVLDGLEAWLSRHEFEEHPATARRLSLFEDRVRGLSENQWLVLEVIAAHCRTPGDSTHVQLVNKDLREILGRVGMAERDIDGMYNATLAALVENRLLGRTDDFARGLSMLWIANTGGTCYNML
jgi:hypothetical protein